MNFFGRLIISLLVVFAMVGCQDDDIAVTTDAENDGRSLEVAGPVGDVTLEVSDLLEEIDDEQIYVKDDGLVCIRYDQAFDIGWESLVLLRDIDEEWSFSSFGFGSPELKASFAPQERKVKLNHQADVRYDSINFRGGTLFAELVVPDGTTGHVEVAIPEVKDNGSSLEYELDMADGTSHTINEDLAGKQVEFSQGVDSSYITVITTFGDDFSPGFGTDAKLDFSLSNMQPGISFGYFGQQEESRTFNELSIDIFQEDVFGSDIELGEIEADVEVSSTIGVPFGVRVDSMHFLREDESNCGELSVKNNNYVDIELPQAIYGDPIEMADTSYHISKDSPSNIVEIANCNPDKMVFNVTSYSNPEGETGIQNFMGPGNELTGNMAITIPASFKTDSSYSRRDTIDFDVNEIVEEGEEEARDVDKLSVYFVFDNKLPLSISSTAKVLDAFENELDTLYNGELIKAGTPNADGYIDEAEQTTFVINLSGDQINQYLDNEAMKIVLESEVKTPGDIFVKIYEDMNFNADVSFDFSGTPL